MINQMKPYTLGITLCLAAAFSAKASEHTLIGQWQVQYATQSGVTVCSKGQDCEISMCTADEDSSCYGNEWIRRCDRLIFLSTVDGTGTELLVNRQRDIPYRCRIDSNTGSIAKCTLLDNSGARTMNIIIAPAESHFCADLEAGRGWSDTWACTPAGRTPNVSTSEVGGANKFAYDVCGDTHREVPDSALIQQTVSLGHDPFNRGICFAYKAIGGPGDGSGTGGND